MQPNQTFMASLLTLLTPALALAQTSDRPIAETGAAERLQASLAAQKRQLDGYSVVMQRYTSYFSAEKTKLKSARMNLKKAEQIADQASRRWNTSVNPTCDNGETYANCSCNDGRVGKARLLLIIDQAEKLKRQYRRNLAADERAFNDNVARYQRFVDQWRQAAYTYNSNVRTFAEMNAPRRPGDSPDSMDEIVRRASNK